MNYFIRRLNKNEDYKDESIKKNTKKIIQYILLIIKQ